MRSQNEVSLWKSSKLRRYCPPNASNRRVIQDVGMYQSESKAKDYGQRELPGM
jgi:hypothetical protein